MSKGAADANRPDSTDYDTSAGFRAKKSVPFSKKAYQEDLASHELEDPDSSLKMGFGSNPSLLP